MRFALLVWMLLASGCPEQQGPCGGAFCTIEETCYDCNGVMQCAPQPVTCAPGVVCRHPHYVATCGGASKCILVGTPEYRFGACCGERFCDDYCDSTPCASPNMCLLCPMQTTETCTTTCP